MLTNRMEYVGDAKAFYGSIPLIMGTKLDLIIVGETENEAANHWAWLCQEAGRLDMVLNRFSAESELSRVNDACILRNASVSDELGDMIRASMRYWELTDGLFDISKGGMREISLDDENHLSLRGNSLDFSGFAKGYLLRALKDRLLGSGVRTAFVNFGNSSIMTIGHHPYGDCWKVGVKDPFGGTILGEVELDGKSMSTSGNIPVRSGNGTSSYDRVVVTVVSDNPLDAEILSMAAVAASDGQLDAMKTNFPDTSFRIWKL